MTLAAFHSLRNTIEVQDELILDTPETARIFRDRANCGGHKKSPQRRDIGGTPGVDCPWPCEVFGRPCSGQLEKPDLHSCAAEPYAMRAWLAERDARVQAAAIVVEHRPTADALANINSRIERVMPALQIAANSRKHRKHGDI